MRFLAHHDVLTELPNRTLFMDRVEHAIRYAYWHDRYLAIIFIDLDRFKYINDSLGHSIGDQVLIEIGYRLKHQVRSRDTVARFGGDEFVVLLEDVASQEDITAIAQKILSAIQPPVYVEGMELHITASLGISLYPTDGDDPQTLLKNADGAMYRAKEAGKNTFRFYSDDMGERASQRLTLENHLRRALERQELRLFYQPQFATASGEINGVEVLLRWQHREFGMVQPLDFIGLLEETGLILPVGEWVIRTACEQFRRWEHYVDQHFQVAVNISARQLAVPNINRTLQGIFDEYHIQPKNLQFEMTESIFVQHSPAIDRSLQSLRDSGISFAIDDFGTGYSSISYLKRFPIDTLKIDRSFIADVTEDPDDAALTVAIITMAHSLGLKVIAEGVETAAQRQLLLEHGCESLQGFLFSKPLSAESMSHLLRERALAKRFERPSESVLGE
jgi:diguanylate cyclase (GGDEF)-like protein